ncbi:hypothetical protein AX15_002478 [Amanita polypyramis BW_CC]|nr:hypothetical protein AX15_002478 [Amanita polypyramis BW_CC]
MYRTFAIYNSIRRIRNLLIGGYVLGICSTIVILVFSSLSSRVQVSKYDTNPIKCYFQVSPLYSAALWLPALAYKLVFVTLAVRIVIKHSRFIKWLPPLRTNNRTVSWVVFIKDCVTYFTITSMVLVINAILWFTLIPEWRGIFLGFSVSALCAVGNRLMFNLVEIYYSQPDDESDNVALRDLSDDRMTRGNTTETFK